MTDPSTYRPEPGAIPTDPGVYRFRDRHGRVIYVGKAKNLRARLGNYFQPLASLHPRTRRMVTTAASVDWTVVGTEVEALALEYSWIKQFEPRFNVKYRDDKSYPYLAVTVSEPFPRAQVMRGAKRKGVKYYGPFGHAWAIRETLDLLLRVFPLRTCSNTVFRRYQAQGRACLLGYIDKCSAPCVGRVDETEHRRIVDDFMAFMDGDTSRFLAGIEDAMRRAAATEDFERAARLRDDAAALSKVIERNAVVLGDQTDADLFALAADDLEAAVQVFFIRRGRITGQRGWIVEKVEDLSDAELVASLLQTVYSGEDEAPREILVPTAPQDQAQLTDYLRVRRGGAVTIRVPRRGVKRTLAETLAKNAEQALALHKLRRGADLTSRSQALKELQEGLDLDDAPLRIECYDISHTGGANQVGSMVVFEDGLARKSEYRHFNIRGPEGQGAADDTAAMAEVLTRRFAHQEADSGSEAAGGAGGGGGDATGEGRTEGVSAGASLGGVDDAAGSAGRARPRRFAYPPNLLVVDGGAPQVGAAAKVIADLGVEGVSLVGLAKRLEEVWQPGERFPVILPRGSDGLFLLQRVRDEAHRFAITAHRKRRSKAMTKSALDGVPGLGPAKQKALLKEFGSVKRIRGASLDELAGVKGIGPKLARVIRQALTEGGSAAKDGALAEDGALAKDEKLDR
ncbi:MAG: excinuclease ABC subunit UvrC [Bifidobacteriaceae bacterium]|jgi:excinuclease ABC subunit C|nr:excinuclease ABC subunit UvrC [Bifidobacteriaceae bacterium]